MHTLDVSTCARAGTLTADAAYGLHASVLESLHVQFKAPETLRGLSEWLAWFAGLTAAAAAGCPRV
jgi:hypothetical protein